MAQLELPETPISRLIDPLLAGDYGPGATVRVDADPTGSTLVFQNRSREAEVSI